MIPSASFLDPIVGLGKLSFIETKQIRLELIIINNHKYNNDVDLNFYLLCHRVIGWLTLSHLKQKRGNDPRSRQARPRLSVWSENEYPHIKLGIKSCQRIHFNIHSRIE